MATFRRRGPLAPVLALIVAVVVSVIGVLSWRSGPSTGSATSLATAAPSTTVRRRNLVETDTESGTLSYADPHTVYNRLSGTITWLPRVGRVIKPGRALYRVDGEPVLLMNGSVPAYRDLSSSDGDGADVEELNRNLVALGPDPNGIVVNDAWQPATTTGVELLQRSLGEKTTGALPLGQIVFLPGDQLISTLDVTLGSTGSGGGSPAGATNARAPVVGHAEDIALTTTSTTTTPDTSTSPDQKPATPVPRKPSTTPKQLTAWSGHRGGGSDVSLAALTASLRAEVAQLKAATAALRAAGASPGRTRTSASRSSQNGSASQTSGGGSATPILQTDSTRLVVTVDLTANSQREAMVGERVRVELPAGNTIAGRITAVSSVAEPSPTGTDNGGGGGGGGGSTSASSSTVPVTITLNGHPRGAGLDQAAVSVDFTQVTAKHVLSVPVTALIATSGGTYAVQEASAPYTMLPVRTGLFAAGVVQISGTGIYGGLLVTDSQG